MGSASTHGRAPSRPLARIAGATLVVAGLGAMAACASIVGFEDDYQVVAPDAGTDAAGGSSGGAGGAGGATGGAGGAGTCAHSTCVAGEKLDSACDPCVEKVCKSNAYCCDQVWDPICISVAQSLCDLSCCGDRFCGGTQNDCTNCPADCGDCTCAHSVCDVGAALSTTGCREACVQTVCTALPACCNPQYGYLFNATDCIEFAADNCAPDPCVADVCNTNPTCCTDSWTQTCVNAAKQQCGVACDCAHPVCSAGAPLLQTCDPCVEVVCSMDAYCCNAATGSWDEICMTEVLSMCGLSC